MKSISNVSIIFQSQMAKHHSLELVFEGTIKLNLVPAKPNYTSEIYKGYLFNEDVLICFSDYTNSIEEFSKNSDMCTYVIARKAKWRFLVTELNELT